MQVSLKILFFISENYLLLNNSEFGLTNPSSLFVLTILQHTTPLIAELFKSICGNTYDAN